MITSSQAWPPFMRPSRIHLVPWRPGPCVGLQAHLVPPAGHGQLLAVRRLLAAHALSPSWGIALGILCPSMDCSWQSLAPSCQHDSNPGRQRKHNLGAAPCQSDYSAEERAVDVASLCIGSPCLTPPKHWRHRGHNNRGTASISSYWPTETGLPHASFKGSRICPK